MPFIDNVLFICYNAHVEQSSFDNEEFPVLPTMIWYLDALVAVIALIVAFVGAYLCSEEISSALTAIGGVVWLIGVAFGINAIWNYSVEVPSWPWGWVAAGYVVALIIGPCGFASDE